MDESVKSDSRLEVSVSFGRFESDALSWEKWSSFSPNKHLEEVGSLSTPGSVAQKKAYFEAHYKKIAAKKTEQLELENSQDLISSCRDELTTREDHLENSFGSEAKFGLSNGENSAAEESYRAELTNDSIVDETGDYDVAELEACNNGLMDVITWVMKRDDHDHATGLPSPNSMKQEPENDVNALAVDPALHVNEAALLLPQIPKNDPQKLEEQPPESENRSKRRAELKQERLKFNPPNAAQKTTAIKVERNLVGSKKKVSPPVVKKPSHASTPKSSVNSINASASQSGRKNLNGSPLPKTKNLLVVERKRAAPMALHMSLSLGPTKSSAALAMTRKSMIMEKMGDKDIVKRAFKSFQNQFSGYPIDDRSSTLKQGSSTTLETKVSPSLTPRKENKGLVKVSGNLTIQKSKLGHQLKPFPPEQHKSHGVDRKNPNAISPSVGLKSYERAEKAKQFFKNLEARSMARKAENVQLTSKSKEEKESEIRKQRQTLNMKATPLPSFHKGQGKGRLEKDVAGSKPVNRGSGSST